MKEAVCQDVFHNGKMKVGALEYICGVWDWETE